MCAWVYKTFVKEVGMHVCVCVLLRLLITSDVIWTPYGWLNIHVFYSFYMAGVVVIISRHDLKIEACQLY